MPRVGKNELSEVTGSVDLMDGLRVLGAWFLLVVEMNLKFNDLVFFLVLSKYPY